MTQQSVSILKLGSWRSLEIFHKSVLVLGILCIFILIATFSKLNSFKSVLVTNYSFGNNNIDQYNTNRNQLNQTQVKQTLEIVIHKIQSQIDEINRARTNSSEPETPKPSPKHHSFLADILALLESVHESLPDFKNDKETRNDEDPQDRFVVEELRKYVKPKPNRLGKRNFMGANATFTSVGHGCFAAAVREDLESYMRYDVGDFCDDDWPAAQRLMVRGCDPLPRRRCFSRAPRLYAKPPPATPAAAWTVPDDRNVRWSNYKCKSFSCLASNLTSGKGFFKCVDCFDLRGHEPPRWVAAAAAAPGVESPEFLAREVLDIKPDEIRIGLDFSVGTGTFAARMKELNVTIVTATINFGAPFSETIALRGLVPLYLTVNQRLPFFDNTLDMIHTTRFLDGWIEFVALDLVLYDWDRVLRPGGLLWIDSFFCLKDDLEDYLESFKMLRYKKRKWVVVPKLDKGDAEVFFSAVLEKPPRPFR